MKDLKFHKAIASVLPYMELAKLRPEEYGKNYCFWFSLPTSIVKFIDARRSLQDILEVAGESCYKLVFG